MACGFVRQGRILGRNHPLTSAMGTSPRRFLPFRPTLEGEFQRGAIAPEGVCHGTMRAHATDSRNQTLEFGLPITDIDPLREFESNLVELRDFAHAKFLVKRNAGVIG